MYGFPQRVSACGGKRQVSGVVLTDVRLHLRIAASIVAAALTAAVAVSAAPERDAPIVFARGSAAASELFVRANGKVVRLTRNRVYDGQAAWSRDGRQLAFVREDRGDADIWVMRADGTGARRLASSVRGAHDQYPAWSSDGKLIAFTSNRGERETEIYIARADGTGLRRLTTTPRFVTNTQPRFSPDGRFVVFASNRLSFFNFEVYRVRASDGRRIERLTFWGSGKDGAPGDDLSPSYSPDGRLIAFVSDRKGGYAVWTMRPDGRRLREVARHPGMNVVFPRFSPDGRRILYTAYPDAPGEPAFTLWTVGVDGSGPTRLGLGTEADWSPLVR